MFLRVFREMPYCQLEECLPAAGEYALLKTGRVTPWDRWSILGWDPWLKWLPSGHGDPFVEFQSFLSMIGDTDSLPSVGEVKLPIPVLMGAIAYDAGRWIESIPATAVDPFGLPSMIFYAFRRYLIADERTQKMWEVEVSKRQAGDAGRGAPSQKYLLGRGCPVAGPAHDGATRSSNFTRTSYIAAVESIHAMIAAGDCYQVNLSQQITAPCVRPAEAMFRETLQANPAPMMALVNAGAFQLISTSPERLVQRRDTQLISRPIKGTRPRGTTPEDDARLRAALLDSEKDNAELAMIVDLVRNDLGRVASPGSVTVAEPRAVESYANVHHLLATVTARIPPATSWIDLLRAVFPGGSVTGCPKRQAMRVIEQLEGVRRGFYCGSIGYIAANGDGDWNIAIRTMTKIGDQTVFNLGGGVVYDSDPALEYEETLAKVQTIFSLLASPERIFPGLDT